MSEYMYIIKQGYIISYNGILHKQYQNYPDICVLKNKLYNICINVKFYKKKLKVYIEKFI